MGFQSYNKNLLKSISRNFRDARKTCSSNSIHDFRVGVKRLRSLVGVLSNIDGSLEVKENERKFKPIYKAAGKVRDIQVTEALILKRIVENNANISEYYNFLRLTETTAKKNFANVSKNKSAAIFTSLVNVFSKKLSTFTPEFLRRHVGRSVHASLLRVAARKEMNSLPKGELHSLRIDAKDARYRVHVLASIQKNNGDLIPVDNWLREIHRAIGIWHDMAVAKEKLEAFLLNQAAKPLYSPKAYDDLKADLNRQAEESYHKFLSVWSDKNGILEHAIEQLQKFNV